MMNRTFEGPTKRYILTNRFGLYVVNELDLNTGATDDVKTFPATEDGYRDAWFLGYQLAKENVRLTLHFGMVCHAPLQAAPIANTPTAKVQAPAFYSSDTVDGDSTEAVKLFIGAAA